MKNLLTAIYSKFDSGVGGDLEIEGGGGLELEAGGVVTLEGTQTDLYSDLSGRMYLAEAPQNAVLPYCVYNLVGVVPEYNFAFRHETATIEFAIYTGDGSAVNVMTYGGHLKTLYDNCNLTVTGYTHIDFDRQLERLLRDVENMAWEFIVEYEVLMSA